jgi:oxygen-independent coproporphyrinogen-3 oxidase
MMGLYIHIPFCKKKCNYCSFFSPFYPEETLVEKYINYVIKEIELYLEKFELTGIFTIYIGGGTPSLIKEATLEKLFKFFDKKNLLNAKEITIEANPEDITLEKAKFYKECGINRVSLGFQSMDDNILSFLGRRNTSYDNCRSFELLRKAEIENISIDWISSVFEGDSEKLLEAISCFNAEHNSIYTLTIERGTPIFKFWKNKIFTPKSDVDTSNDYRKISRRLKKLGYIQYEVSNFAREEKFFSRHNLTYWNYGKYIGAGMGAVGFFYENNSNDFNGIRWTNFKNFKSYFCFLDEGKLPVANKEKIDFSTAIKEFVMLGLRKTEGFGLGDFENIFHKDFYDCFCCDKIYSLKKYIKITKDRIAVRKKFFPVMNEIIRKIWDMAMI